MNSHIFHFPSPSSVCVCVCTPSAAAIVCACNKIFFLVRMMCPLLLRFSCYSVQLQFCYLCSLPLFFFLFPLLFYSLIFSFVFTAGCWTSTTHLRP
ncbi:hypothetical protein, unlikely [Trypanosoma brucei brucei TREU927]|uniref:Uncharacterized protein n=1 Tax=Trypanosoma brucei brucei (strain 927/4 GUTat10.1) TaxID=185431 RepID=Q4GZD8_TRYB2|nr:hypothetical protein, unlikely [Trypanosoma brucei brucei TREU927]CAJ15995.1 hypothetical protein, unlikely [Trypanosoma brucei brucei TREU927]